jgi:membrane-associated phospholipid phosphatase
VRRRLEFFCSAAALLAAFALNHLADGYIERVGETAHTSPDLILGILPGVDVSLIYWWGAMAFVVFAVGTSLWRERERLGYLARAYALVIAARACLMVLTPLHIPDGAISVDAGVLYSSVGKMVTVHHDLFFSMHTAMAFLGALVFRDRWARWISAGFSVLMALTVLLLKTHYSLDVAGAYLVTYALYRLQRRYLEPPVRSFARA